VLRHRQPFNADDPFRSETFLAQAALDRGPARFIAGSIDVEGSNRSDTRTLTLDPEHGARRRGLLADPGPSRLISGPNTPEHSPT